MCDLTVEFWREKLRAPITDCHATVLKEGFAPSRVYRVALTSDDSQTPRSVIFKCVHPPWGEDEYRGSREVLVYTELLAHIPIPQAQVYFANPGSARQDAQLVLEDLNAGYAFQPETHAWTWAEGKAMLRTLAQLHARGQQFATDKRPYLMSPLHTRWSPARMREMFRDLYATEWLHDRMARAVPFLEPLLSELPRLQALADREPRTLVHYDVYPPNVAFTRGAAEPDAVLIDWAAATADIAEIDLGLMFQQPYRSDALIDWRAALRYYWEARARLTGTPYAWDTRVALFHYARLQAVFIIFLATHRNWVNNMQRGTWIAANAPDFYDRFFDAALNDAVDTLAELSEDMQTDD